MGFDASYLYLRLKGLLPPSNPLETPCILKGVSFYVRKYAIMPRALHGDEWHPHKSPSLDGRGKGRVNTKRLTPTLILPHRGGGDFLLRT
ncbi:MAG: hypothetical protein AMK69_07875 [Nitrospira bacterium SG8_3]|nr:MAG: hypothetical protein AMK69_07875 [Nitrospira bacterium SG8_3]